MSVHLHMCIVLLPVLIPALVPNLKHLAPVSTMANICMALGIGVVFYYMLSEPLPDITERKFVGDLKTLPLFFGTAIYAFEGIALVSIYLFSVIYWKSLSVSFYKGSSPEECNAGTEEIRQDLRSAKHWHRDCYGFVYSDRISGLLAMGRQRPGKCYPKSASWWSVRIGIGKCILKLIVLPLLIDWPRWWSSWSVSACASHLLCSSSYQSRLCFRRSNGNSDHSQVPDLRKWSFAQLWCWWLVRFSEDKYKINPNQLVCYSNSISCHRPAGASFESHHFADWRPLLNGTGAVHSGRHSNCVGLWNGKGSFVRGTDQEFNDYSARSVGLCDRHDGECGVAG